MKRTFKLNGEVSPEANDMLVAYCKKHERSKGFLLEKMIRKFCVEVEAEPVAKTELAAAKPKAPKAPRKKLLTYPDNLDEQFLLLWDTKGKKGAKQKAYEKYRSMMAGNSNEICEQATLIFINDINKNKGECGYPELHLTTYLNQERWDK
jgi:hypothetical protein